MHRKNIQIHLHSLKKGDIAQLVEQQTENLRVAGSIPAITTLKTSQILEIQDIWRFFYDIQITCYHYFERNY